MDGAQVGVLEQADQVSLRRFLQSQNCVALEAKISLEILGNLPDQALERQLPNKQLSALLILPDLTESNGTRPIPVRLLHTASGWGTLASSLGSQLLPRGLTTSALTSSLFSTSHLSQQEVVES